MKRSHRFPLLAMTVGLAFSQAEPCRGSAYEVTPVQVQLSRRAQSALLTIKNVSDETLRFQLTVYEWSQNAAGEMQLDPTRDVVFFPTVIAISAGEERKVRVGASLPSGPFEKTYRLVFEELPPLDAPGTRQIRVLTRMGIPIFLEPEKIVAETALEAVSLRNGLLSFSYRNAGNVHVTLRSVRLKGIGPAGETFFDREFRGWYVLAGGSREYRFDVAGEPCLRSTRVVVEARSDRGTLTEELEPLPGSCSLLRTVDKGDPAGPTSPGASRR